MVSLPRLLFTVHCTPSMWSLIGIVTLSLPWYLPSCDSSIGSIPLLHCWRWVSWWKPALLGKGIWRCMPQNLVWVLIRARPSMIGKTRLTKDIFFLGFISQCRKMNSDCPRCLYKTGYCWGLCLFCNQLEERRIYWRISYLIASEEFEEESLSFES